MSAELSKFGESHFIIIIRLFIIKLVNCYHIIIARKLLVVHSYLINLNKNEFIF